MLTLQTALLIFFLSSGPLFAAEGPDQIPPLRPPRGEIPPGFWEQYSWLVILGAVLFLVLLGLVIWLLTRPKPPPIPVPAAEAHHALEPLRQQPENGAVLSRISQVLRRYCSAVFGLPPEELTTAEFCRALQSQERVGPELASSISSFLRRCDERKFAPTAPQPALGAADQALQLVAAAETRLAQLAQAAAAAPPPVNSEAPSK